MKAAIETVRLQEPYVHTVAEVLARAFFDDPSTIYVEPDDSRGAQVLPVFYEVGTRYAYLVGEAYTTAEHIEGAALWIAPDSGGFTSKRMAAAGGDKSSAALGPEAFGRFMKLMTHLGGLRAAAMPSPHWYLMILGVEPSRQGMGIGSQLIQPVLNRADALSICKALSAPQRRCNPVLHLVPIGAVRSVANSLSQQVCAVSLDFKQQAYFTPFSGSQEPCSLRT